MTEEKSVRPSINAPLRKSQLLFAAGTLLVSLALLVFAAIAGWGLLAILGLLLVLFTSCIWGIVITLTVLRNRKKRFHRGLKESASLRDFLQGR